MKNLPVVATSMALDVLTNVVDNYFKIKKETQLIEHETIKIQQQTKVALQQIEINLELSLDKNQKMFDIEMNRINIISKALSDTSTNKNKCIEQTKILIDMLKDPSLDPLIKEQIPIFLNQLSQNYYQESSISNSLINNLTNFDCSIKSIENKKGEK